MTNNKHLFLRDILIASIVSIVTWSSLIFEHTIVPGAPGKYSFLVIELSALFSVVGVMLLLFRLSALSRICLALAFLFWASVEIYVLFIYSGPRMM